MSATFDATTKAAYDAATTATARAAAIVASLTGTISVKVYNASDVAVGDGTMDSPWATASGGTVTVGEVTEFEVTTTATPDSGWYIRFENSDASRWVRASFGLSSSSQDFKWSLAAWESGQTGGIGTATIVASGNEAPSWTATGAVAPTSATISAAGGTIQFTAVDPEGGSVLYALTTTRSGIRIDSATGLVTVDASAAGTSGNIVVTASDGILTAAHTCAVTVLSAGETVLLTDDFSSTTWYAKWHNPDRVNASNRPFNYPSQPANITRVTSTYTGEGYVPRSGGSGNAIRIRIPSGANIGTGMSYYPYFPPGNPNTGGTPNALSTFATEIYLEYWLRFGSTWFAQQNGKLPGFASGYATTAKNSPDGFGGSASDGYGGWTARGKTSEPCNPANWSSSAANPYVGINSYVYHADMDGIYGEAPGGNWGAFTNTCTPGMNRNQWYKIRYYWKASGPGTTRNGIIRGWVNDVQVMQKTNYGWDFSGNHPLARVWMNVYHGGGLTAPQDIHLFMTDVRIWTP